MRIFDVLTPWRAKWYPIGILIGIALGFAIALVTGEGATTLTGRLGGDFPAFYAAGRLAASGEFAKIYDLERMTREEEAYLPGEQGVLPFPYPPHVALAYAPLSCFSFRIAYVVHTIIMLTALIVATRLIVSIRPDLHSYFYMILALCLFYYPMMRSVFGGQNTAISFLLITLVWYCTLINREFLAGLCLGALLFKPQFALPLLGLFVLSGRWRSALTGVLSGLLVLAGSYALPGQVLVRWFDFAPWFSEIDAGVNRVNSISFPGFLEALLGSRSLVFDVLGWTLVVVSIVLVSAVWFFGGREVNFSLLIAVACPVLILAPPHVMYYDISISILSVVAIFGNLRFDAELIGLLWLLGWSQILGPRLGFSPLFFSALGAFLVSVCISAPKLWPYLKFRMTV